LCGTWWETALGSARLSGLFVLCETKELVDGYKGGEMEGKVEKGMK